MRKSSSKSALEIIDVEDSPKKLDAKLKKNYGFGLYEFTASLVDVINSHIGAKAVSVPGKHYRDLRTRLRNLLEETVTTLYALNKSIKEAVPFKRSSLLIDGQFKEVQKLFDMKSYLELLKRFRGYIDTQEDLYSKDKGRQIEPRNLLAVMWSRIMVRKKTRKVDWSNIVSLFEWFYLVLKNTYIGPMLLPVSSDKSKYMDGVGYDEAQLQREVRRNKKLIQNVAGYAYYRDDFIKDHFLETISSNDIQDIFSNKLNKAYCIDLRVRKNIPKHDFKSRDDYTDNLIGISGKEMPPQIIFPDGKILE